MRTKESIRIELIQLSHDVQDPNKPQYREFERRGEGVPYERGYTAGFQEGMDMTMKAMDEYAKEVSLKFSEYWGQITPEQLQYFIIEKGTPEPIVQYKTREEVFDEWISKYQQETSSLK